MLTDHLRMEFDDHLAWYNLASLVACRGQLEEAQLILDRDYTVQATGGAVGTALIRLDEADLRSPPAAEAPAGLATDERLKSVDLVHLLVLTAGEAERQARPAVLSAVRNAGVRSGVHLHVLGGDENLRAGLGRAFEAGSLPVCVSGAGAASTADPYVVGLQLLPHLLRAYGRPVLFTGAGEFVAGDLGELVASTGDVDVALFYDERAQHDLLSLVRSTPLMVWPGEGGVGFCRDVLRRLGGGDGASPAPGALAAALAAAVLAGRGARVARLSRELIEERRPASEPPMRPGVLFWTFPAERR